MERKVYVDCAKTMVNKLCDKINGKITFEIYPEIDTIIFKIVFKDFKFSYAVNEIQEAMHFGSLDKRVDKLVSVYKGAVLHAFFKHIE